LAEARDISDLQNVQTGSWGQPGSYAMDMGLFPWGVARA